MMPLAAVAPDDSLLPRLAEGDTGAFSAIYRRHHAAVYRFALFWSGSAAVAADVTHDAFLELMNRPGAFDPTRGTLAGYLCGIARNLVRRHRESNSRLLPIEAGDAEAVLPEPSAGPLERLLSDESLERLRAAILRLPPHYRDVLVLYELSEYSYLEIAAICGCELGTVRSRLARARGLLTTLLAPRGNADANPAIERRSR